MKKTWEKQIQENADLKQAAATACITEGLIMPHDQVFMDRGTTFVWLAETTFRAAERLAPLTVATTSAEILKRFLTWHWERHLIDLWVIGGKCIPDYFSFDGAWSLFESPVKPSLKLFRRAFMGISALDDKGTLLACIMDIVTVKQNVMAAADEVVIVCDETKLASSAKKRSQAIGTLRAAADGGLSVMLEPYPSEQIAARVVIGVSSGALPKSEGGNFLAAAQQQGAVERRSLVLARPTEEQEYVL